MKQNEALCEDMEWIIEQYKDMVYRIVMMRVRNPWDADDVFQEVFLTYFRKKPELNAEEHRKAWLIRTAMNLAKKSLGSTWKQRVDIVESVEDKSAAFSFREEEESQTFLAMKKLPEKYQTVLYLFYFEEMTTKDIASLLSVREGSVRMRLSRAREQMADILRKVGFDEKRYNFTNEATNDA